MELGKTNNASPIRVKQIKHAEDMQVTKVGCCPQKTEEVRLAPLPRRAARRGRSEPALCLRHTHLRAERGERNLTHVVRPEDRLQARGVHLHTVAAAVQCARRWCPRISPSMARTSSCCAGG